MPRTDSGPAYSEAIALLQKALVPCDEAAVGKAATPDLDLSLNLLLAECQTLRTLAPAQD